MATERARPALLQELLVAHDERHSYMQRMHSLAGPGAYTIPSTFKRRSPNMLLRVVQRDNYGRKFARQKRIPAVPSADAAESAINASCQLCLVTATDTHRARRDQLRKLLHLRSDKNASSPTAANVADSRTSSPRTASPDPRRSLSSRASSPSGRRSWMSADLADIVADFGERPAEVEEQPGDDVVHLQVCAFSSPPTYQHFLMSTSYLERLKKQRRRAASQ